MDPVLPAPRQAIVWEIMLLVAPSQGIESRDITCSEMSYLKRHQVRTLGRPRRRGTCYQAQVQGLVMSWFDAGLFHFVYGASPHQILLHLPIILLHFPIKFASFPQQIASSPQQITSFPQQIASFPQQNSHFPITILLHFAKNWNTIFWYFFPFFIFGA